MDIDITSLKAEACKKSFHYFFKEFWDIIIAEELVENFHIKYLCDELQKVGEAVLAGEDKLHDLIINIPPGTTKSTIASVMFPAWLWTRQQSLKILTGSHSSGLSLEMSVKSRDIVRSQKYTRYFPNIRLKDDSDTKSNYKTVENGVRIATSVGSSAIGMHSHIIIIDDPVTTNPSSGELRTANNWITNELATRKVDKSKCPTILIMQRISEKDPSAEMLNKSNNVKHICLPAIQTKDVKPAELAEQYVDGLLDPKRLSRSVLRDMKTSLGSYGYSAQFLQTPSPEGGGIIGTDWVKVIDEEPEWLHNVPVNFWVDTAYTKDTSNDPSAIVATKLHQNNLYVIGLFEEWLEFPQLVKRLGEFCNKYGYDNRSKVYIEPKASGLSVVQSLQNSSLNVVKFKAPTDSKDTRLKSVSPKFEARKIKIVDHPLAETLIAQLTSFKPVHDDMRDCLTMAIEKELMKQNNNFSFSVL